MEKIITNVNNLKEEDMTDFTTKVKALLINDNNELLLAYCNHTYEFPGGTQEVGENLIDTLNRELIEEVGVILNITSIDIFAQSLGYYKDWPEKNRNKKVEINYYVVKLCEEPNFNNMKLTDNEKNGNFELRYISLDKVMEELDANVFEYGDDRGIAREMKKVLSLYINSKKGGNKMEVKKTHVGAYGVVVENDKIVLIRKARGGYKGKLDLPGGGIEHTENPNEALKRELMEEVGVQVLDYTLLDVTSTNIKWEMESDLWEDLHHIGVLYNAKIKGDSLKMDADGLDSDGANWYEIDSLSKKELSPFAIYSLEKLGYKLK